MDPVTEIFAAFGKSPTALSKATGVPVQTVCDWRRKGKAHIPVWRRATVLAAIQQAGKSVSASTLAYLASDQSAAA